jgi:glycosyltransferase involved in cell wall biosynthesis
MEKISACLVVINEEKLIGRCLESLRGVVDEIILVHDGDCSDKTLVIAKEYGAKIFVRPFYGVAEGQRPFSYEQASNNWILQIDADEFLSEELRSSLRSLASNKEISAYEMLWPLWDGKKEIKANWPYKICLFRKEAISLLGLVHFVVRVKGKIKKVNLKLKHQPEYSNSSFSYFLKKQSDWAQLQAKKYLQDFSSIPKFNWTGKDWPESVRYRIKFPLILIPLEFIWTFLRSLLSGAYRAGWPGVKTSTVMGIYRASVNYYISKLKYGK